MDCSSCLSLSVVYSCLLSIVSLAMQVDKLNLHFQISTSSSPHALTKSNSRDSPHGSQSLTNPSAKIEAYAPLSCAEGARVSNGFGR
jgi:hypothetical protein